MSVPRIRKNDTVISVAGVDVGKTGKVMQVLPAQDRVVVEGLNLVKKCLRKTQDTPEGGMVERERAVDLSNVMLYCPKCKKGVRTARAREGGRRVRTCRSCGHGFDS